MIKCSCTEERVGYCICTNLAKMNFGVKRKQSENGSDALKRKQVALERWNILAETLRGQRTSEIQQSTVSVRRFQSFGLMKAERKEVVDQDSHGEAVWYSYSFSAFPGTSVAIRHVSETIKPSDLLGFNNTGNVCVWPSEEVMTHYCLQHLGEFRGASVIELGGGMTSLAGVAITTASDRVTI